MTEENYQGDCCCDEPTVSCEPVAVCEASKLTRVLNSLLPMVPGKFKLTSEQNSVMETDVAQAIADAESNVIDMCGKKISIVTVKLWNGFTITETSTCVSADNFSEEIGIEVCLKKIIDKIWNHLGFMLSTLKYEASPKV